jgi:hypothetical protein
MISPNIQGFSLLTLRYTCSGQHPRVIMLPLRKKERIHDDGESQKIAQTIVASQAACVGVPGTGAICRYCIGVDIRIIRVIRMQGHQHYLYKRECRKEECRKGNVEKGNVQKGM